MNAIKKKRLTLNLGVETLGKILAKHIHSIEMIMHMTSEIYLWKARIIHHKEISQ